MNGAFISRNTQASPDTCVSSLGNAAPDAAKDRGSPLHEELQQLLLARRQTAAAQDFLALHSASAREWGMTLKTLRSFMN
jgi:hypothetical protein